MSFTIEPKTPAVPDEPYYPIDRLYLFDRHDRISWERSFGEQSPPFDPSRPRKAWADTSVLKGVKDPDKSFVEYNYFDSATRTFGKFSLSVHEAATPNLPGRFHYPEYIAAPTSAVILGPNGEEQFNVKILSHKSEADQLAKELGADSVIENPFFSEGSHWRIDWRGEQRHIWLVRLGSHLLSAALLLQRKYRDGVGAPGNWVIGDDGTPLWVSRQQETGEKDARPEVPIPCRPLAGNEALYLGHPMKVFVYRTDRESEFNQEASGTPAFPPDLRATLDRIDANIQHLLAMQLSQ